jgi:hypothetical protein
MVKRIAGACALMLILMMVPSKPRGSAAPVLEVESFGAASAFFSQWKIKKWVGNVTLDFLRDSGNPFLRLTCPSSSWAFVKKLDMNLDVTPVLTWSWKVDELPKGGDGRHIETDDEAAQVYVFFPGKGLFGSLDNRIIGYTWEDVPEPGTFYTSPKNKNTKVFVLRNRGDGLGVWRTESRDVQADYRAAFGEEAPRPVAICFQIDSDDTRSTARSDFSNMTFTRLRP